MDRSPNSAYSAYFGMSHALGFSTAQCTFGLWTRVIDGFKKVRVAGFLEEGTSTSQTLELSQPHSNAEISQALYGIEPVGGTSVQ